MHLMLIADRTLPLALLALVLAACGGSDSPVEPVTPPADLTLRLEAVATGLSGPVFAGSPPGDARLFVVEQAGRIRIVANGQVQPAAFLDISSKVLGGGERGLLSITFHPRFATNRFFYLYYTAAPDGAIRVERYTASASNPQAADPASAKLIFTTPHPLNNHNGGLAAFGPDGMMFIGLGDGGGAGDPNRNAQNLNVFLGSMLRIDVDSGDPYVVPAGNPYIGQAGRRPEIWAKGLRNPWRFAFDATTALLYVADVGQGQREEVSVVPSTRAGVNYGWNITEGSACYNAASCDTAGLEAPALDYTHAGGNCSITGGYVYGGSAIPALRGHYFYSDFCAGGLRSFRYSAGQAVDQREWATQTLRQVTSFGQDAAGELYVIGNGIVYRITQGS